MKARELRNLSKADLEKQILDLQKELFVLSMRSMDEDNNKTHLIRAAKRQKARVKTVLRELIQVDSTNDEK